MMDRSALMHLRDISTEIIAKLYLYPQQLDLGRQTSLIKLTYNQRNLIWMGNRSTIVKCVKNWRPLQHSWWRRLKGKVLHLITSFPIVMIFMAYRCKSMKKNEIFIAFTRISGQKLFFQKFEIDYQLLKAIKQGSAYTDQLAFNDASRYEKRKLFLSREVSWQDPVYFKDS